MCEAVPDCNCLVVDPRGKPFWFHGKKGFKLVGATFKRSPWDFYYITERLVDDDDDYFPVVDGGEGYGGYTYSGYAAHEDIAE